MLFKHYVGDCSKKHEFMSCKNCNDSILINDEIVHETKCIKKLATKCPLCLTKVNDLLKLK